MDNSPDFLFTMAEVAAAFAGFATLVSAILHRHALNLPRVLSMVSLSLMVVIFSLLPSLPAMYGAAEASMWQASCAALATSWAIYWALFIRAARLSRFGVSSSDFSTINRLNMILVHPVGICLTAAGAFGVYDEHTAAAYATALFLLLSLAALLFMQVSLASFSGDAPTR